jgi:hypothetical protein
LEPGQSVEQISNQQRAFDLSKSKDAILPSNVGPILQHPPVIDPIGAVQGPPVPQRNGAFVPAYGERPLSTSILTVVGRSSACGAG